MFKFLTALYPSLYLIKQLRSSHMTDCQIDKMLVCLISTCERVLLGSKNQLSIQVHYEICKILHITSSEATFYTKL